MSSYDVVDSGRNAEAHMIGSVIAPDVYKVEATWRFLPPGEWAAILQLFIPNYGGQFLGEVTLYDHTRGDWVTRTMYIGDRSSDLYLRASGSFDVLGTTNNRIALIEV
jgi:hypothetical protein